jgi:hypothetical protein
MDQNRSKEKQASDYPHRPVLPTGPKGIAAGEFELRKGDGHEDENYEPSYVQAKWNTEKLS